MKKCVKNGRTKMNFKQRKEDKELIETLNMELGRIIAQREKLINENKNLMKMLIVEKRLNLTWLLEKLENE